MDVVGHDDVAANRHAARFSLFGKLPEFLVNGVVGEQRLAGGGAAGDEINRRVVALKYFRQTMRFIRMGAHAESVVEKPVLIQMFSPRFYTS